MWVLEKPGLPLVEYIFIFGTYTLSLEKISDMHWKLVNKPSGALHEYHLIENNLIKVVLKYNPLQHSARVFCEEMQRLFFIEHSGVWSDRTIFQNEYGIEIRRLSSEKSHNRGTIEIDGKKYYHSLRNNPYAELLIYENDMLHPVFTCGLQFKNGQTTVSYLQSQQDLDEFTSLLLGICWYLFLPETTKNTPDYAPDFSMA